MNNNQIIICREDKLIALGLEKDYPESKISEDTLDKLYNINILEQSKKFNIKSKNKDNFRIKKSKKEKININDKKYILTLEFLNAILKVINKKPIDKITEFKDISRNELSQKDCNDVLEQYLNKIIEYFSKTIILYKNQNKIKLYILTVIKCMTLECGYNFKFYNYPINKLTKLKTYERNWVAVYSIVD